MRWFLVLTAAVAAFLAIVLAVGLFLPRRNRVAASGLMPGDPDRVWDCLADPHRYAEWRPGVMSVEPVVEADPSETRETSPGTLRWKESSVPGSAVMEMAESEPGRIWAVRSVEHDLPFSVQRRYELEVEDGGTRVTVIEERHVDHPAYRFLFRFLVGPEKRLLEDLRGLRDRLAENG